MTLLKDQKSHLKRIPEMFKIIFVTMLARNLLSFQHELLKILWENM